MLNPKQAERAYYRRQRKLNYPNGRHIAYALVPVLVLLAVLLLAGCQVGDSWRDPGTGNVFKVLAKDHLVEYADDHADTDPVNAWDQMCRLSSGACWPWDPPQDHLWHIHRFHDLLPGPFGPVWWVHDEGWHNYLNCRVFLEMESQWECHRLYDPVAVTAVRG